MKKSLIICTILLFTLLFGTGIHGDDYIIISLVKKMSFSDVIFPSLSQIGNWFYNWGSYFLLWPQYHLFKTHDELYLFSKIALNLWAWAAGILFLKRYWSLGMSSLISFLILFLPNHDSVNYWVMGNYMLASYAGALTAIVMIDKGKKILGFLFALISAFFSYASPPFAVGIFLYYLLRKEFKNLFLACTPYGLYTIYYVIASKSFVVESGVEKVSINGPMGLVKNILLQGFTFFDANFGPSHALKIFWSAAELSYLAFIIFAISFYVLQRLDLKKTYLPKEVWGFFIGISLSSLLMYATTGRYPQLAFNLGNRVSFYHSGLVVLIFCLINRKQVFNGVVAVLLTSIIGLSFHWKDWNKTQVELLKNVNMVLHEQDIKDKFVLVKGHEFSKLGPFPHIDFFNETNAFHIFSNLYGHDFVVGTLNSRVKIIDKTFSDKNNGIVRELSPKTLLVNVENFSSSFLNQEQLEKLHGRYEAPRRHWLYYLKNEFIYKLVKAIAPSYAHRFAL